MVMFVTVPSAPTELNFTIFLTMGVPDILFTELYTNFDITALSNEYFAPF